MEDFSRGRQDRKPSDPGEGGAAIRTPSKGDSSSLGSVPPSDSPTLIDIPGHSVIPGHGASVPSSDSPTMVDIPGGGSSADHPSDMGPDSPTMVGTSSVSGNSPAWGPRVQSNPMMLQQGALLGQRYEILQILGEGGMGAVYKARDRELNRMVALKVIRPELAGSQAIIDRFKQELLLSTQVTHKNVIRIYDLGEADGMKFITMEFVEGEDLRSLMQQKQKMSPVEAVEIMLQVCRALEAAHSVGIIHRDLKPQNIMRDKAGRILVMDFGLARTLEGDGMTQTGALVGTMDYMSPEQALGKDLDQRSDLFTLGLIFYELLTGKMPYKADSAIASLLKRTQERAAPVSSHDATIPKPLSDIVSRCMDPDVNLRYTSSSQIMADLEAWQGGRAAATLTFPASSKPWGQTIPWHWIGGVAAALVLAIVGFLFRDALFKTKVGAPSGPVVSLAILPFRNVSGDPSLDLLGPTFAEMLRSDMGQSADLRTVPSDRINQTLHDLRIAADASFDPDMLRRIGKFTSADRILWGQYLKLGDQIRIDATLQDLKRQNSVALKAEAANEKELPRALEQLAQSVEKNLAFSADKIKELQARALKPSSQSVQALGYYSKGLQLAHQGKNVEAQKSFQAAIQQDPNFALAYARLGQVYVNQGYGDEAEQATRKAVALGDKLPAQESYLIAAIHAQTTNDTQKAIEAYESLAKVSPDDSDVQFALAGLYNTVSSFDKAREYYEKVLVRDPNDVEALYGIAGVEINVGNPQAALESLNRALTVTIELNNVSEQSRIVYGLGMAYSQMNKPEEALRNYQQALEIQRRLGAQGDLAQTLNAVGQLQDGMGKSEDALKSFQEALRVRREIGDKIGLGYTLIDLSNFYEARGQNDQALDLLKQSLAIQREVGNRAYEALCLNNIGISYADKGQYDDALTYINQALELREKLKDTIGIADSNYAMAEALTKFAQYEQAMDHYLRALELWRNLNDKRRVAFTSYGMGNLFEQQGRLGAALKSKDDALKTIREAQDRVGMAEMLGGYSESLNLLGRGEESQKPLEEALSIAREVKNQTLVGQTLNFDGDSFFYRGDFKTAKARYEQALKVASGTTDRRLILISKFNLEKIAVKTDRSREAISALRTLAQQADAVGLRYLSMECSVYLGEALVSTKDYPQANQELERTVARSEKLGMQVLQAKSHYLLGLSRRLTGKADDAAGHYAEAHRILDEISKEAKSDTVLKRADLVAPYTESAK